MFRASRDHTVMISPQLEIIVWPSFFFVPLPSLMMGQ